MNKRIEIGLVALTLSIMATSVSADSLWGQLKKRVKNEVENVVTGKVARKAGEKVGDATDAVLNPELKDPEQQDDLGADKDLATNEVVAQHRASPSSSTPAMPSQGFGGMLKAMKKKVDIEDSYRFDIALDIEITQGKDKSTMAQALAEDTVLIEADSGEVIVMDMKNKAMIVVDNKKKTKMPMSTDLIKQMAKMGRGMNKKTAKNASIQKLEKTGKSKELLGFKVDQWIFEDGTVSGEIWVTGAIDFDFIGTYKKMTEAFGADQSQMGYDFSKLEGVYPTGLTLEMISYKNGKLDSEYSVIKVNQSGSTLDLSEFRTKSMMEGF
ncbi:MAG: DUF4412 domain-containing protein [Gammaproteobacteria bacterium]|nr:DUF4412 domain-containing protein [Gammaproteobacteria bacterium]